MVEGVYCGRWEISSEYADLLRNLNWLRPFNIRFGNIIKNKGTKRLDFWNDLFNYTLIPFTQFLDDVYIFNKDDLMKLNETAHVIFEKKCFEDVVYGDTVDIINKIKPLPEDDDDIRTNYRANIFGYALSLEVLYNLLMSKQYLPKWVEEGKVPLVINITSSVIICRRLNPDEDFFEQKYVLNRSYNPKRKGSASIYIEKGF